MSEHQQDDDGDDLNEDWEEWDGRSPFWAHCAAGSLAGVVEHAAIYPLDTVRTHIQVCASCVRQNATASSKVFPGSEGAKSLLGRGPSSSSSSIIAASQQQQQRLPLGMWQTIRYLVSEPAAAVATADAAAVAATAAAPQSQQPPSRVLTAGWTRLFRGVQTILIGCIPAHALYFSSYELVKGAFLDADTGHVSTVGSSLAGAAAVTAHDLVMTPLDTLKQRLQLGHYAGVAHAVRCVARTEGFAALYRSFPITLASNVPYGMVMVATHERCKRFLSSGGSSSGSATGAPPPQWQIVLGSSSVAGLAASAVTTPLDRIKTALQTQRLAPVCRRGLPREACGAMMVVKNAAAASVKHVNWRQAAAAIWREEGAAGFFRGLAPRVLSHTPAVAISWTTYETAKQHLLGGGGAASERRYHH